MNSASAAGDDRSRDRGSALGRRFLAAHHIAAGRFAEALGLLDGLGEDAAEVCGDRGLALAGLGRFEEAAAQHRRAVALAPEGVAGHNNLGLALLGLDRPGEALAAFEEALRVAPDSVQALVNHGRACAALGRATLARASFRRAHDLDPSFDLAYRRLLEAHLAAEDGEAALSLAEAALARDEADADALCDAGRALMRLGRPRAALDRFDRALALRPDIDAARLRRAAALSDLGRPDEAVAALDTLIAERGETAAAHLGAARALVEAERQEEALLRFDAALRLDPDSVGAHSGRGTALRILGRLDEARAACRRAVEIEPEDPVALYHYGDTKRFTPADPDLAALEALQATAAERPPSDRMYLHYALAKAYADVGRHRRVVEHAVAGGALKRREPDGHYDEAATLAMFRRVAEVFTPEALAARAGLGDRSDAPVFIVGMPRSGTTLTEQILASHPAVHGAGELSFARRAAAALRSDGGTLAYPDAVPGLPAERLCAMGAAYLAEAHAGAGGASRVTDKLPENFVHLGLIRLMLPNARIVHARRHPADTCFSCFTTLFAHLGFTFDMGDLGRYYAGYEALMAHWRAVLPPDRFLEVRYEDTVRDIEAQARRLVAFCGLPWDDRCLAFHENRRPVRTASVAQVRRPLYASSVGRWRPYRRLLAPLLTEIAPAVARYEAADQRKINR